MNIDFEKMQGLVPAIVQDSANDEILMLGFMNQEALDRTMSSGFATEGTFTSPVLDATQISRFGKMHLRGTLPKTTSLTPLEIYRCLRLKVWDVQAQRMVGLSERETA